MRWLKRIAWLVVAVAVLGSGAWLAWPRPIAVDIATATRGPIEVTIDDEARTRVRHVYVVAAPVTAKLLRISSPAGTKPISLHVGDDVIAGVTLVAVLQPVAPSLLDVRSKRELTAALAAATAAVRLAEAEVDRITAVLAFSREELDRAQSLAESNTISPKALDAAQLDVATNEAALASAEAQLDVRRSEYDLANARLIGPEDGDTLGTDCCIEIRAPATGRVLKINQDSEGVVAAGTPLLEIGDPDDLEVVADLLSSDAVQITVGAPVRIDGWGGDSLNGTVSRIEPEGFAKVSSLGIEEQRVQTVIDFTDPVDSWSKLGNNFRVIVHVRQWQASDALLVPVAALFRRGTDWAVFRVKDGTVQTQVVDVGHRNSEVAEVLAGLSVGDSVVLHPSDRIRDGVAVTQREAP